MESRVEITCQPLSASLIEVASAVQRLSRNVSRAEL